MRKPKPKYPSVFRRLFAAVLDVAVLLFTYMGLGLLLALNPFTSWIGVLPMLGFWFYGGIFVFSWLYFALLESSKWQGTFGKRVMGIEVVDQDGRRVSFGRATGRYFGKYLSRALLMIGFVMVLFTKKRQALHDKLASCVLICS